MSRFYANNSTFLPHQHWRVGPVTKAIGNNKERKENHSTETQDFNVKNPLQQREVKTTDASQQNFTTPSFPKVKA
jgi:hypothetical protein